MLLGKFFSSVQDWESEIFVFDTTEGLKCFYAFVSRALTLWATALYKDPLQLYWDRAKSILGKALLKDPHYLPAAYVLADIAEHEKNLPLVRKILHKSNFLKDW